MVSSSIRALRPPSPLPSQERPFLIREPNAFAAKQLFQQSIFGLRNSMTIS